MPPVLMVGVVEEARDFGGVPTHQQAGALGGQSAQDRLEDVIPHTAGLVDDIQHILGVEALEGIWLAGGPGHGEPFLGVAPHVDLFTGPDKAIGQDRV